MWDPLIESNVALVIGFPVSVAAGGGLGLALGRAPIVDRLLGIYVDMALVVPIIAVVPIIIVAFGITLTSKVAVVVLFALPVVALSVRSAVRDIDRDRVEMARSFGATARHVWPKVILPAALPAVFSGLRVGLSRAISGMIVVELTLVPTGIGGLFVKYRSQFDAANLYAVTLVVLAEGIVLAWLMRRCEALLPREAAHD
jgi:ABC-type nitrate/sulfonate/bicarbonate transport system permease component